MNCLGRTTFGRSIFGNAIFGAALCALAIVAVPSAASAQSSFRNYRCADGSQFMVGFFQYDKRAHMQVDGKAVTLHKRATFIGTRYSGGGVTMRTTKKAGTTLKVGKRKTTACQLA